MRREHSDCENRQIHAIICTNIQHLTDTNEIPLRFEAFHGGEDDDAEP